MIKIKSVEIDGFITPSQKVKLDFVDSNVICIYGNNGSGKTSFLEILFAVFDRNEEILSKYEVNKIKIEYILDDNKIKQQINELKKELELFEDREDIKKKRRNILDLKDIFYRKNIDETKEEEIKEKIKFHENEIEEEYSHIESDIEYLEKKLNGIKTVHIFKDECIDDNGKRYKCYNFDILENSELDNVSSLFLGIGRGIHKNKLKIPRNMLWYFFNNNRKISDNKILTANEIDKLTDELQEYLTPKDRDSDIENYKARELDDKKNIYLSNIEIDTIEAFLNIKYQEAVLDAKERIEKSLAQTSLKFLQSSVTFDKKIDFQDLKEKLLYNKSLLLEMFNDDNIGIMTLLDNLEKNENYLEQIDKTQQEVLVNIILELQSEVELWHEIKHFLEEYNKFLNYNKKLVFSSNGVFVTPENHSIQRLSSGERHLLTFLATILLMGEEQDFILLDEPEISLDVDWVERFLPTVSKLAPNSQIIVATHNLTLLGDYFDESSELKPERK